MKLNVYTPIMAIAVLFFCLPAVLFASSNKIEVRPPQTDALVSHELIRQAGWTYNWQLNLPLKDNEQVDQLFVHDQYLYAVTDTNILFCIDRQKGRTLNAVKVCHPDIPLCPPIFDGNRLAFIAGNQIVIFDASNGTLEQGRPISQVGNIFSCGVSRNTDYFYITGSDKRLHVIAIDGLWQSFSATADNDSAINSVKANDEIVVFSTQAGNVVGMNPNKAQKYWQYDISGQIQASLIADERYIYVAGMDAKLYKLDTESGRLVWDLPFHSGAPLRDPVTLGARNIYVYNDLNGLYSVDQNTGKAIWNIPSGRDTICEVDNRAFIFARPGVLKVMDNTSGKESYSVNFSNVQRYAINTVDSVMYLGDAEGRLMSVTVK